MKHDIRPLDVERQLAADSFIVSKADPKGRFTYANKTFMAISGYAEAELIGVQHNLVRHPDMPRVVYRMLWESIQNGREFFGVIKNLCKDGAYYWVFANITPDWGRDRRSIQGYLSVRRRPGVRAVATVTPLYRQLLEVERRAGAKDAIEASTRELKAFLAAQGTDYENFVLSLRET